MAYLKTLGRFPIQEIISMSKDWQTSNLMKKVEYCVDGEIYIVNRSSHRYACFSLSTKCFACGLEGGYFLLQQAEKDKDRAHFNLYGTLENEEILFTKDHIKPKSKGGADDILNYQTMCLRCNMTKANNESLVSAKEIVRNRLDKELALLCKMQLGEKKNILQKQVNWLYNILNKTEINI